MADFSTAHRKTALRMLRRDRAGLRRISPGARELYAVGLLICDDDGRFPKADLREALADPSLIQAARNLLREAKV